MRRQETAPAAVTCNGADDCEVKWGRAATWVKNTSEYKVRKFSEYMIQTSGPKEDAAWAFSVTRIAEGNGQSRLELELLCGNVFGCVPSASRLQDGFYHAVMDAR